ncbi:MAG TPA: transglycosylase domain-containing protein [Candidatus Dormibacteraeota bacterium]|nr:transglycosylase domain-containing protein [Candidatus Dormibacteraeota bacterium]
MAHLIGTFCPGCGHALKPDSRFCPECGRRLTLRGSRVGFRPWMIAPAALLAVVLVLLPTMLYVWAGLPSTSNLSTARLPLSTRIYDRTGTVLLAEIHQGSERRHIVPLAQVSPTMQRATIAVEDRTFYQHGALNLLRTGQAGLQDLLHLRFDQGGSTITQQLVKNIYLSEDRSVLRKLDEVILAIEIEHQYSKNQILEAYLNRIYYGNQSYGVEAAAQTYFGKPATQLALPEASLLAGLPQAPTELDPYANMAGAKARQHIVLDAMVRAHEISKAQATAAYAQKLSLRPASNADNVKAPGFVHWVAAQLEKTYGNELLKNGGLTVVTSLDWNLQSIAEQQVRQKVLALQGQHVTDGSLVAVDPKTGGVLAMVGSAGPDVPGGQYNMAVIPRQPGSSFKLFTYTAAIESGKFTMASFVDDAPLSVRLADGSVYTPHNYDGSYHGWQPLPHALGNSLNIPAVKVELGTGIDKVVDVARRMGVTTLTQPAASYQPSLTLGGYEVPLIDMAAGASTLAAQGVYRHPQGILRIAGHDGKTLFRYDPGKGSPALTPQVSFIMSQMLSDDSNRALEFGRNSDLVIPGHQVAAKTGTTNDFRDNLTVGFTPDLAVAVWVGNADHSPMQHVSGIVGAAPIFHDFMTQALNGKANNWYAVPDGLHTVNVAGYTAYLLAGTEQVAQAQQAPLPPATCEEGCGGGGGHHHHGGGG